MIAQVADREKVFDALEIMGFDPEEAVYEDYSGRSMYGEKCFGVVFRSVSDYTRFVVELGTIDAQLACDLNSSLRQDDMGLDQIFYFPGYELDEEKLRDKED